MHWKQCLKLFLTILSDKFYADAILNSLQVAFITACITVLVAYPLAYQIAFASKEKQLLLLLLFLTPSWVSFLLKVYLSTLGPDKSPGRE